MPTLFCPIYRDRENNELIVTHKNFFGTTYDEAFSATMGNVFEMGLFGLVFNRIAEIDPANVPHNPGRIGPFDVAIIGGPMFQPDAPPSTEDDQC